MIESFGSARELLDALRPTNARWFDSAGRWVYRGHGLASWRLVPSLWRDCESTGANPYVAGALELLRAAWTAAPPGDLARVDKQRHVVAAASVIGQIESVRAFATLADELQFAVPADAASLDLSPESKDFGPLIHLVSRADLSAALLPPTEMDALAQHHGVRTRLLDWTSNPLVAAFFAAHDAIQWRDRGIKSDRLCVWALHPVAEVAAGGRIQFLYTRRQFNSFMRAQQGLFTWDRIGETEYIRTGAWPCQADVLGNDPVIQGIPTPALRKLELPTTDADELLYRLRLEGVSLAHLKPTLDNVSATVMNNKSFPFRKA